MLCRRSRSSANAPLFRSPGILPGRRPQPAHTPRLQSRQLGLQWAAFSLAKGSLDATNVLMRVSDGFRSLADQIGDPIRLGEIGTFKLFEFDIGIGMAAGKQCGDVPISGVP